MSALALSERGGNAVTTTHHEQFFALQHLRCKAKWLICEQQKGQPKW
jgi:hypothetical protein